MKVIVLNESFGFPPLFTPVHLYAEFFLKLVLYHFLYLAHYHLIDVFSFNFVISIVKNHYKISREKFEPEPGFEPRTSGFLARCSTT